MTARKTSPVGNVVAIPLSDGRFVVAQVIDTWLTSCCIAVTEHVVQSNQRFKDIQLSEHSVIALPSIAIREIRGRKWRKIGHAPPLSNIRAPHRQCAQSDFVGAQWCSAEIIELLVDAYFGLGKWDVFARRPDYLKNMLLPEALLTVDAQRREKMFLH